MNKSGIGNIGNYVAGWARRSPATFLLHVSLIVILCGAIVTSLCAMHGQITVYADVYVDHVADGDEYHELPFAMRLDESVIDYYPASTAPRSYSCKLTVVPALGEPYSATLSMDHMLIVDHFRFTLVSIGVDSATLTVNHDPWGIFITYLGYGLLFASMVAFFFQPRSGFRVMLRKFGKAGATAALIMLVASPQQALAHEPPAIRNIVPANVARTFGKIYVYWDERPAPMQTMSRSILAQVYGGDSYCGQTADQVMLGWIVYYDMWKNVPIIKVKSRQVRDIIGISGKYASLMDFFDANGYKLQPMLDAGTATPDVMRVDRSVQLLASVAMGSIMRIYPYMSANNRMEWLSWTDHRPSQMPAGQWVTIETTMRDVVASIVKGNADGARSCLLKIRRYQLKTTAEAGAPLSQARFRAEIIYNGIASVGWGAMLVAVVAAISALLIGARHGRCAKPGKALAMTGLVAAMAWLLGLVSLRWYIAGHWPLTNGPESMQVMALMALCIGALFASRYFVVTLMSMIVAAMSLAVAAMSGSATVISPLLPVLNNPLLSIHVFVIMLAYALLTIIMLLSAYALVSRARERMMQVSMLMLYPAVFLLAAGIFIGAIWANQSWGRYWGWDPKETWALITMLVYSVPLHWTRLRMLRSAKHLAIYLIVSYITVIITYFGVNFLLGGLHSYS